MPNIVLERFMIFNSKDGRDEGREHEKLLFHWTKKAPDNKVEINEQIDDVCLCDASINASIVLNRTILPGGSLTNCEPDSDQDHSSRYSDDPRARSSDSPISPDQEERSLVLKFDTKLLVLVEIETNLSIWMAALVSLASTTQEPGVAANQQQAQTANKLLDQECIASSSTKLILRNIYLRFSLLHGTFQMLIDKLSEENNDPSSMRARMRSLCDSYFTVVLSEIHLNSLITNIPWIFSFIVYLDLNPSTLMRVNSFINHLVSIDADQISNVIVIFNDQLLWSSMNMTDTRLLYNYLVAVPIRDALQEELSKEVDKVRRIRENMPIYLTGASDEPTNIEEGIRSISLDCYKKKGTTNLRKYYLTLFRSSNNMTVGLILKDPDQFELIQRCESMLTCDSRLGVIPLASLAQSVGQNYLRVNSFNPTSSSSRSFMKRKPSLDNPNDKNLLIDQKYLCVDRLCVSADWSHSMDIEGQGREHPSLAMVSENATNLESGKKNRKLRLTRYLLELDPELKLLKRQGKGTTNIEFIARTTSDTWLTVMNSKYRSIYSTYNMRNVGLSEAHQYATNLRANISGSRFKF